jgi:cytochrome c oxidase subunit 3
MAAEGSPPVASQFADRTHQERAAVLGIWVFLATEALFFGTLFASYAIGRVLHPQAFAEATSHTDVVIGSINTTLLLTTSLTMSLAVRAGAAGWRRRCVAWLVVTVILGLAFLGLKGYEYYEDWNKGLLPGLRFHYSGPDVRGATLFFFMN